jgi:hypothetical protein
MAELERVRAQPAGDADFMPDFMPDHEWYSELAGDD